MPGVEQWGLVMFPPRAEIRVDKVSLNSPFCNVVAGYDVEAMIYLFPTLANLLFVIFRNDSIRFAWRIKLEAFFIFDTNFLIASKQLK